MDDNQEDICPICHEESLYAECEWGNWVIGCDNCNIKTSPCESYEEADEEWNRMMRERISFITKID